MLHISFSAYIQADSTKHGSRKTASSKQVDKGSCHETEECCSKEFVVVFIKTVSMLSGLCLQRKFFRSMYFQCKSEP